MIYIGKLEAAGSAGANNHTTATTFDIPDEARHLWLESDTAGVEFEIGPGSGSNYDTYTTSSANGTKLYDAKSANVQEGPFDVPKLGRSPSDAALAWVGGHVYSAGDKATAHGWTWLCMVGGTSNVYGTGPAYGSEADGTVTWRPFGRAPDVGSTPYKTLARIAIFNPTGGACVVRVWAE